MELSEDELTAAIVRVLSGAGPEVIVGPGDDAAVLAAGGGELVLTADALIEGVHFDLGITSARDLGYKAIVVSVSDIAAMGASPHAALVTLALRADLGAAWVIELYGGMRQACDEHALWLVGGDLSRAVKVNVYLRDMARFPEFNDIYRTYFPDPAPARTTVQSSLAGFDVEIDAIVALDD